MTTTSPQSCDPDLSLRAPDQVPAAASIVSGYFNPTHLGHLRMMQEARALTGYLVVIVNNDAQQVMKKGKVITGQEQRLELVRALRVVDDAMVATDDDGSVRASLEAVHEAYPGTRLVFCNGGDRRDPDEIPSAEGEVCARLGIEMRFGVGGTDKLDSSSRILSAMSSPADGGAPS